MFTASKKRLPFAFMTAVVVLMMIAAPFRMNVVRADDGGNQSASVSANTSIDDGKGRHDGDGHDDDRDRDCDHDGDERDENESLECDAAFLNVTVNVVNDGGGTKAASDFTVNVTGSHPAPASFVGSASGTKVTLGSGTFEVKAATSTNYQPTYSDGCSGIIPKGATRYCTVTETFQKPVEPENGSISVCKVIVNASDTIIAGNDATGTTFTIARVTDVPSTTPKAREPLATTVFTAPLVRNAKLFGASEPNAQCVTYGGLKLGHYYYGQEVIANPASSTSKWGDPKYNDQNTAPAGSVNDVFAYSGELFDANPANDGARNTNADGDLFLTSDRPSRQLIVVNRFLGNEATSTKPSADLAVTMTADVATTTEGATIHYTVTVQALGPATSTGVSVADLLPAGLTFVSSTSSTGTYASSTGLWTVGTMSASTTQTLVITATVNVGTAGTTIANTATASEDASVIDPNPGNNSATVSIPIVQNGCRENCGGTPSADLKMVKTADATSTSEGATVSYTLTVSALGPATSTGVVATDTLPAGLTFMNATASVGTHYASSTGSWTIGDMPAGSTATLVIAAKVNTGTASTTIVNTATVAENASTTDPNPENNSSSASVAVAPNPGPANEADLVMTKTVDNANPKGGDTVDYTLTVAAHGPATSTFVHVADQLPTGLSFVSASSSQGTYSMGTGDWDVGTLAAGSSATLVLTVTVDPRNAGETIVNTATASELSSLVDSNPADNSSSVSIAVQSAPCTVNCGGGGGGGGGGTVNTGGGGGAYYLLIDNDAPTTATTSVMLTIYGTSAYTMELSNTPDFASSTWEPYVTSKPWVLTSGAGTKQVYVKFRTVGGNDVGKADDSIELIGAPVQGEVLGASTTCGIYLYEYIKLGKKNDPAEVKKLQIFLNQELGTDLPVTGFYGQTTYDVVKQFQLKYHGNVLAPWVPHGLGNEMESTGYVYKTTKWWINMIKCPSLDLPIPALP